MKSITYLTRKTKMSYEEVLKLPYYVFLVYIRDNQIYDLLETEGGREYLAKVERLSAKEADLDGLRKLAGYRQNKGGEDA